MNTTPRIAVLVPAYNPNPEALRITIESVYCQTTPADVILFDDGSKLALIAPPTIPPGGHDSLHLIRSDKNRGITEALYRAMEYALGAGYEYIARLDIGDTSYPDRIQKQVEFLQANPSIDLVGCRARTVDMTGAELYITGDVGPNDALLRRLRGNSIFRHSTFMFRSSSVERLGNYDKHFPLAQDYELLLRYARNGRIACLPDVLVDYEMNPSGLTIARRRRQLQMRMKAQLKHFDPLEVLCYLGIVRSAVTAVLPAGIGRKASYIFRKSKR